jgi:hypothetical protein
MKGPATSRGARPGASKGDLRMFKKIMLIVAFMAGYSFCS